MKNPITSYRATLSRAKRAATGAVRRNGLLLAALLGLAAVPGRAQTYTWATKTTKSASNSAVVSDKAGNSYVLYRFTNSITVGGKTFTSLGSSDLLLSKYAPDGKMEWGVRIGGTADEQMGGLVLSEGEHTVYVTGSFQASIKFTKNDGTTTQLTSAGATDLFVASFSAWGKFGWAQRAGGTGADNARGIDTDKFDNLYVTGSFTGTTKFTDGNAVTSFASKGVSDIFLAKFNANGVFQVARQLGGANPDYATSIAVDKYYGGDIYVTGSYASVIGATNADVFLARYSPGCVLQTLKVAGTTTGLEYGNHVIIGWDGAYVTGSFTGTFTIAGATLTSSGSSDIFVAFFPRPGALSQAWAKRYGGAGWDEGAGLTHAYWNGATGDWRLYLAGSFTGTASIAGTTLNALGGAADRDMFLACISQGGGLNWARRMGSAYTDHGFSVSTSREFLTGGNTLFYAGHINDNATLGNTTLAGSGGILTRIDLPTVNDFHSINAMTDAAYKLLTSPTAEINLMTLGTNQINLRANATPGSAGSVRFVLDGVAAIDNTAPFTWAGDSPKLGGGTNYWAFTPAPGKHQLSATPFSGPNGTGVRGRTVYLTFTVVSKPVIKNVTVINAITDADIQLLDSDLPISYSQMGTDRFNLRANLDPYTVGSVKFVLNGVTRIENGAWPYCWGGETPKPGGGFDYHSTTLPDGYHELIVTAYSGANATGSASDPYHMNFYVDKTGWGGARVAAEPGPEAQFATLKAAPNPFTLRTSLSFTATEDGPATLEVCNAQGLPVARLFEGTLQKGQAYAWQFDGTAQPAGLYVARLKVGHKVLHQRLVLSK
ncbi:MAG: SBBP repeat-containing protein [Cytophagales bacterium]|nr:SBBP repeat-containing protein [Cytophagales bacterium]